MASAALGGELEVVEPVEISGVDPAVGMTLQK